jgi:hypothetical protein
MFSSILLALSIALGVCATPHQIRHHEIAKRHTTDVQLHKRFSSARWTFYDVGLGACGKSNIASDFIVALNTAQFGSGYPGPHCFKMITMNYNGKTAQAQIMDECPGCPYGGLDLSRGLFSHFASEAVGVLQGEWSFNDGSGGGGNLPSPKPPKTTSTPWEQPWTKTPTSTWEQPTTTPKPKPKPSTTTTSTTTSEKPSTTTSHTTTSSSSSVDYTSNELAVPTGIPSPNSPQNLNNLNDLIIQYGELLVAAVSVH